MQWAALWQMALALLPLPLADNAAAWTRQPQDEDERRRQRERMQRTAEAYTRTALRALVRAAQLLAAVAMLFGAATLLYALLYYMVIPSRLHEQDIFFDYGTHAALSMSPTTAKTHELTLPTARLNLLDTHHQWTASPLVELPAVPSHVLVPGVKYDVIVELTMPESQRNKDIGMFMLQTTLASRHEGVLATSARSAIVKDAHPLVEWTRVGSWFIAYALRLSEQTQTITVPVVNGFKESKSHPLTNIDITLNHPALQIYSAKLTIIAQLSGVRYLMYHWWLPTALLVILNIVFVEALALLVLYAFYQMPSASSDDGASPSSERDRDGEGSGDDEQSRVLDKGELFELHRSGGIPPVHVERTIKQEPGFDDRNSSGGGVTTSSLLNDDVQWKLRFRDDAVKDSDEEKFASKAFEAN